MRVSTSQIHTGALRAMLDGQARLQETQLQLATGRRVLTPADDPAAAARILSLTASTAGLEQYGANAAAARARLGVEETALAGAQRLLVRARELAIQGGDDALAAADRDAIAEEVRGLRAELVRIANSQDANGEYVFAGFKVRTEPFTERGAGVTYNGDGGQRFVEVGPGRQVAVGDAGSAVFLAVPTGNGVFAVEADAANTGTGVIHQGSVTGTWVPDTYTIRFSQPTPSDPVTYTVTDSGGTTVASGTYSDGAAIAFAGAEVVIEGSPADGDRFTVAPSGSQDLFATLDRLLEALGTGGDAAADALRHNRLGRVLADLDRGLEHLDVVRARVGARLAAVESQEEVNADLRLQLEATLSGLRDLDYAEAVSRFNVQLTALRAAQQTFARVQGLSLFQFL
ncbi:flagellar hook-associated protein FlgL [Inmirania thermothiophila]|uniref:Flagellar hook-associated protein 3 FlgL n=1 Tax=Inmirania thermothiophila TaxID=1750597 RepID=A0A3N1Y7V4_9GAMM|nr:flagellar hook-associated protein FlgL [Inmirania thermothiophila]ROR34916.1 flagellar hook-associated protein 3 FlgL [Inmirania thermothiophila]